MVLLPDWTGTTEEKRSLEKELDEWAEGGKVMLVVTDKEHLTAFALVRFFREDGENHYSVLRGFTMHGIRGGASFSEPAVSCDIYEKTAEEALTELVKMLAKEWH